MACLIWTEAAKRDLNHILAHCLDEASLDEAQAVFNRIREQVGTLRMFANRCRPGCVAGTRKYVLHRLPYVAVAKVQDDTVAVLALAHTARLYP